MSAGKYVDEPGNSRLARTGRLPDAADVGTVDLARKVNAERLAARRAYFRAHAHPTSEVRVLLGGVTRQAVSLRVANKGLVSLELAGTSYFPDWQFGRDGRVPGLSRVLAALTSTCRGVLAADAVIRTPLEEEGGRTPAQLLAAGDIDALDLRHDRNLDALGLDDQINTSRAPAVWDACRRLVEHVHDWYGDRCDGIVYRSRTTPERSANLAFFSHARLTARRLGSLGDQAGLLAACVLSDGFAVEGW
jgi:hypothetical protein